MGRIIKLVRRPVVWLALVFFVGWTWICHSITPPTPNYRFSTGAAEVLGLTHWGPSTITHFVGVSDDGRHATIVTCQYHKFYITSSRSSVWDTATGQDVTPEHWRGMSNADEANSRKLLDTSEARKLLADADAWTAIRNRMEAGGTKALDDIRRTIRPVREEERPGSYPESLRFSPDGLFLSYVVRNDAPVFLIGDSLGDGTVVEEARTGRRIAYLPGVTEPLNLAPGGRTAVSHEIIGGRWRKWLWNLDTSSRRVELLPSIDSPNSYYSPDGRYVLSRDSEIGKHVEISVRWWDASTGQLVGTVENAWDHAWDLDGRILLTKSQPPNRNGVAESYRFDLWDAATGTSRGVWNLDAPSDGSGLIDNLEFAEEGRFLVGEYDPEYGVGRGVGGRVVDRLSKLISGAPPADRKRAVVWDVRDRREVCSMTGRSAALSANGRWLATIDKDGIVRVLDVTTGSPWRKILTFASAGSMVSVVLCIAMLRLTVRLWRCARIGRVGRIVKWMWTGWRKRWTVGGAILLLTLLGFSIWHIVAAERAKSELEAVYEVVLNSENLTEADVTRLVGRPPDAGSVTEITGRKKGGGKIDPSATMRKWSCLGTELEVHFSEDGMARCVYISDPRGTLERIADWLGI
jgi:hypothetical protein